MSAQQGAIDTDEVQKLNAADKEDLRKFIVNEQQRSNIQARKPLPPYFLHLPLSLSLIKKRRRKKEKGKILPIKPPSPPLLLRRKKRKRKSWLKLKNPFAHILLQRPTSSRKCAGKSA